VDTELARFAEVFARTLGVVALLPFNDAMRWFPKLFVAVALALFASPHAHGHPTGTAVVLLTQFGVGVLLGAPLKLIGEASSMFGELIDTARGQTIGSIVDPIGEHAGSDLASLGRISATVLALSAGALELLVLALSESFRAIPIGAFEPRSIQDLARGALVASEGVIKGALVASVVWTMAFFVVDLACAFAARLVSGLSFTVFGAMAKLLVTGILLVVLLEASLGPAQGWIRGAVLGAAGLSARPPALGGVQVGTAAVR
jgi:type III secretory pathway component EscT